MVDFMATIERKEKKENCRSVAALIGDDIGMDIRLLIGESHRESIG